MKTFRVKIGKGPDEMTFDECMAHINRVLFWDYVDGEWCDVEILNDRRWEELAGYIKGAHEREVDALKAETDRLKESAKLDDSTISALNACIDDLNAENFKLRELVRDMWANGMCECDECGAFAEGQYHCAECEYHYPDRMRDLGIEVEPCL